MKSLLDACQGAPLVEFAAREVLLPEGDTSGRLYVLKAGSVEVLRRDTQITIVDDPGAIFGEMSVMLARPHTATVRCLTPATLYVFDDAAQFLCSKPEIAFHVARIIAARLNAATSYLADVNRQFDRQSNHLGMIGEVLDTLCHDHDRTFDFTPERESDPRL